MDIVKVSPQVITKAAKILKHEGVIVFPTDTAYAIGGIFNSPKVVKGVLKIKERTDEKFTVVAADIRQVEKFFKLNKIARSLGKKYWPGPLSIAVSKKYAVRVPDNGVARRLAKLAGAPLIASSANISGLAANYSIGALLKNFRHKKNQPVLVINAGRLKKNPVSTIVAVKNNKIVVIRPGSIKLIAEPHN